MIPNQMQQYAISQLHVPCTSAWKGVLNQNLSYENKFDLHENEPVGGTHFHTNGFASRLVLTQSQQPT